MPIENERKYVLYDPNGELEDLLNKSKFEKQEIVQIYLSNSNRIRKITTEKDVKYFHTFKYKTTNDIVVEIETKISYKDFKLIFNDKPPVSLDKIRYKKKIKDVLWDIDFLKHNHNTYFALAEAEFDDPDRFDVDLLPIIEPYVIHIVSKEDTKKYTNFKLCDLNYASTMMESILTA